MSYNAAYSDPTAPLRGIRLLSAEWVCRSVTELLAVRPLYTTYANINNIDLARKIIIVHNMIGKDFYL